jgi:hypothetical protein
MRIDVTPTDPSPDTELHIRLLDLPPGEPLRVRAGCTDPNGGRWESSAELIASAEGAVNLHRDAPVSGTHDGVDQMGLVSAAGPVRSHPTAAVVS